MDFLYIFDENPKKMSKKQAKWNRMTDSIIYFAITIPFFLFLSYMLFNSIFINFDLISIAVYSIAFIGGLIFFGVVKLE